MSSRPITTREQLARRVAQIGRWLQSRANRRARLEARIATYSRRLDTDREQLNKLNRTERKRLEDAALQVFIYCQGHRPELVGPRGKTAALDTGTASWRESGRNGPLVFTIDEATTIAEIRTQFPDLADELIKTTQAVIKTALKARPDVLDEITTAYVQAGEIFSISPANTNHIFTMPVRELEKLAAEAGLMAEAGLPAK